METKEALTRFLQKCEERGLSPETRRTYHGYLRHFADEHPELPTDTGTINKFLAKRGETPKKRGGMFKKLQAFYAYLEQFEGITSPVPPKGKVGRSQKVKLVTNPATQQVAEQSTLSVKKLVRGGSELTSTSISTVDAVKAFIRSREVAGVTQRTLQGYPYYFKPFILKFPVLPITTEQVEEFLGSLKVDQETKWTYNKTLKALYHFLEQRKKIPKDLIAFPRIKIPRKVRRVLTLDELRQLFHFAENFQEGAILQTLIDTKVRASELVSMTREKLFPPDETGVAHATVKGKTGERDVPLKTETYDMLVQLAPSGPLFRLNGKPMKREYLRVIVRRLMQRAGLDGKKLGPHILRHSASVQHMMFGGDLLSLKEELGHTTTRMTEKYGELAFPQVKQRHQQIDVLGHIAGQAPLERARCYGCNKEIVLELAKVKETECPGCGQVGKWYLPNHRTQAPGGG